MIHLLRIQNLAIVDEIEVEFNSGLNVLTGETGAGKSLIIGALNLLVGGRPSSELVRTGADKATIQAILEDQAGTEIIVRREISANGRNRIYIDQNLATAAELKRLGERLVDLHGQHQHQALLNVKNHIALLDNHAKLGELVNEVAELYDRWQDANAELTRDRKTIKERKELAESLQYQLSEIETVAPALGEDVQLEKECRRLANAERLLFISTSAYNTLYEQDASIIEMLAEVRKELAEIHSLDAQFAPQIGEMDTIGATLDDLVRELRSYSTSIEVLPQKLASAHERLSKLESLNRKYGGSITEVLKQKTSMEAQLEELNKKTEHQDKLIQEVDEKMKHFLQRASTLSARRKEHSGLFTDALLHELDDLSITDGNFEINFKEKARPEDWDRTGIDDVEFYFSANRGEDLRPLNVVASGGELSRLALGLKTIATIDSQHKTLVFDEIDAGISGATAEQVGIRLSRLGSQFQVLCVTHSPQIASKADSHYHVSKETSGDRVITAIDQLNTETLRVEKLAQLMTGTHSKEALASALELLRRRT